VSQNEMPFESGKKYGGEVDWDGGADEFVAALGGHSNSSRSVGSANAAAQSADDTVDASIFGEAGNTAKYLGRD
jgi:hypothetical protein